MKYMGSKNRIAKYILPIMLEEAKSKGITTWIEPFVGGGNMIDKVPPSFRRIGIDVNGHVIQAMIDIRDFQSELPSSFSFEDRKFWRDQNPTKLMSWACIVTSFGADLNGGYARECGSNDSTFCNYGKKNAAKQSPKIQGVDFICGNYLDYSHFENCLIYCDPPYQGTTSYKTNPFDHDVFWDWVRKISCKNMVFVSEYKAPSDFICVWEGKLKTNFASNRKKATHNATEKLFVYAG